MAQIFAAVGLTGYLSLRNGQKAVNNLVAHLETEVSNRVNQHLDTYLATPNKITEEITDSIKLGILNSKDLEKLGRVFWKMSQLHDVGFIYFGTESGEYADAGFDPRIKSTVISEISPSRYSTTNVYIYRTDEQGNRTELAFPPEDYRFEEESWYPETIQTGKPTWSSVYSWEISPYPLAISITRPVYDRNQELIGVVGVEQRLSQISQFLRQIQISPSGKIFLMERDGSLIASSTPDDPFTLIDGKPMRLNALDSQDASIRATANYLIKQFGNFQNIEEGQQLNFNFEGQRQFVQVTPWRNQFGLDWIVVLTVPESDFMAQINANTRTTVLLCLLALAVATSIGMYTAHWITQPIVRLSQASAAIASGDLEQTVEANQVEELRTLAFSFNAMAGQVKASFDSLERNNEQLEARVMERTAQLQEAKEMADAANQAKSDFLSSMSHELRTPLNGILGYAQILKNSRELDNQQRVGLNVIEQCGTHLLTLINDILDLAKIEARKLELCTSDFYFGNFIQGICDIGRVRAEEKEIAFEYEELNHLPPVIHADEKRLRQVLLNLISNAIKFTDHGRVTLKIGIIQQQKQLDQETQKNLQYRVRFQVEDTGVGMTPEQVETIFLPFEQVGSKEKMAEGTGLGLAISCQIVEMMGGKLSVDSTPGIGSRFWFDVNLASAVDWCPTDQPQAKRRVVGYSGKRRTIQVVDDHWENRSVLVKMLEPIGFHVIESGNGKEGLAQAQEFHPDLIITDLSMPIMDGFTMTQALRQSEMFKTTPILAFSASVFDFNYHQSQQAGCNDFLPKPVQLPDLLDRLQSHLKLDWMYDEDEVESTSTIPDDQEVFVPPAEELIVLYKAAKAGFIVDIQTEVKRLKRLDPAYVPFANKIIALADEFETSAIAILLEPHLPTTL